MRIPTHLTSALKITLLYLLFSVTWVLFSDRVLAALTETAAAYQQWQSYKGTAFVLASAIVVYLLVDRESRIRHHTEQLFTEVLDLIPDPVLIRRPGAEEYAYMNSAFTDLLGRPRDDFARRTTHEMGLRVDPAGIEEHREQIEREGRADSPPLSVGLPDGSERTFLMSSRTATLEEQAYICTITKDVTALQEARDRFEDQVRRIQALRDIDMAITASLDVQVTLNVVLDQVTTQLEVDAANILLVNKSTRSLEYAAGRGFRTRALRHTRLEFGEGHAGRAAENRTLVMVDDLRKAPDEMERSHSLEEEDFVSYLATPLSAKGHVNGVLEIFHRSPLDPPQEWFDFLDTLAGQASIAIDNSELYRNLQRSNEQLRDAYDRTIEGWARALDLRDRETYGHTRRVAEVTVRLAETMGVPEDELVHIRRGALLHDIGKMGVPDSILLKPGPLDGDEWAIMKRHPTLAFRLLSPIEFLRPALEIPHYHHEKWDGSGYPSGLRGEEIPLSARIFAVVDVWDALLSDRSYRDAWSEDEVYAHLEKEAGSHFDPEVMDAFLSLDLAEIPIPERRGPEKITRRQKDLFENGGGGA